MQNLVIVYYVFLNSGSNWQVIVTGQLMQLKGYGIFESADFYVHITDCAGLEQDASLLISELVPSAIISMNYENQYEYPALKLIFDLACKHPDSNFIYFHTKGMSYNLPQRSDFEIEILTKTFEKWTENVALLRKDGVSKVGLFPAIWNNNKVKYGNIGGWIFYNFWYASGDYLSKLEEPKPNANRYYYEGWL